MKKGLLLIILCVLIVLDIGFTFGIWYSDINKVQPYRDYYNATESFLDTLEHYDNWVDRFDPYEYYEAKENLK
jgi:hypothetical protein